MDFSEKQMIPHAIISGLCNRAEGERGQWQERETESPGGREERAWAAVGLRVSMYLWPQARCPLRKKVLWCPRLTAKRMPTICKIWLHVSSCTAASWGALGTGRGEAGQVVAGSPQCWGDPAARGSSGMGWDAMRAEVVRWGEVPGPVRAQRMMASGAKRGFPICKLLENYFLMENYKEKTQHFSLR